MKITRTAAETAVDRRRPGVRRSALERAPTRGESTRVGRLDTRRLNATDRSFNVAPGSAVAESAPYSADTRHRSGSRILQGQVSNPSESGSLPPSPIILTHVTGTKQFFGLRRNSWHLESYVKSLTKFL